MACGSLAFVSYALLLKSLLQRRLSVNSAIGLGFFVRIVLVFSFPAMSDDIYRFLWDGHLIHSGIHPLSAKPVDLISSNPFEHSAWLFQRLNSPEYYTIYPPAAQFIFYIISFFEADQIFASSILFKLILLGSETGILVLLLKFLDELNRHRALAMIYFLNPLIIIEVMGNIHFESLSICAFLGAMYLYKFKKRILSAVFYASSVALKLLPLMFLPVFLKAIQDRRKLVAYYALIFLACLVFFVPFFLGLDIDHFLSSLDLYFQKFEFNAGLYYLLRWILYVITGYNQILILGPALAFISVLVMLWILKSSTLDSIQDFFNISFGFFVIYLLFSTTIHPWYLAFPLVLSVFNPRVFILVWSFMVLLSYSLYSETARESHYLLIALEYLTIGVVYMLEKSGRLSIK